MVKSSTRPIVATNSKLRPVRKEIWITSLESHGTGTAVLKYWLSINYVRFDILMWIKI